MNFPKQTSNLEATCRFWKDEFYRNELRYPNEDVVRFLNRVSIQLKQNKRHLEGLDIGFGSGRHLKLLMDYEIQAHGVELFSDAVDRAFELYGDNPFLGKLKLGDYKHVNYSPSSFDVIIAWGSLVSHPPSQLVGELNAMQKVLRPGGRILINLRTKDNWFFGYGKKIENGYFLLDKRAGNYAESFYAFFDEATLKKHISDTSLCIKSFERIDQWRNELQEKNSWWIVDLEQPI